MSFVSTSASPHHQPLHIPYHQSNITTHHHIQSGHFLLLLGEPNGAYRATLLNRSTQGQLHTVLQRLVYVKPKENQIVHLEGEYYTEANPSHNREWNALPNKQMCTHFMHLNLLHYVVPLLEKLLYSRRGQQIKTYPSCFWTPNWYCPLHASLGY